MRIFIIFILFYSVHNSNGYGSIEDRLLAKLFDGYDKDARPVVESVQIQIQFYLKKLYDVDSKEQILYSGGYISQLWNDPRLRWNVSEFDGISDVSVRIGRLWTPDIALTNAIGGLFDNKHLDYIRVNVINNGDIINGPGGTYVSSCKVDITYFPFDEQVCHLNFGSWVQNEEKINVSVLSDKVILETYLKHAEWEIVDTYAHRHERIYTCCPDEVFAESTFIIHLRRKPLYFIIQIVVPSIFLSVLVVMIFCLPSDSGEKISLGITVLLSFSVFMFMVAEKLPRSSDTVPLLGIYLAFFMGTSTLAVVLSILVLKIYHHGGGSPPPVWLRKLMFVYIGRILSCCQLYTARVRSTLHVMNRTNRDTDMMEEVDSLDKDNGSKKTNERTLQAISEIKNRFDEAEETENVAKQWKDIARIMDTCFLMVFSTIYFFVATYLLGIVPLFKPVIDLKTWQMHE